MSEIVKFPTDRIVRRPDAEEYLRRKRVVSKQKRSHLDEIVHDMVNQVFLGIEAKYKQLGLETVSEQFRRDMGYIEDAIEATVWRSHGLEHHLHHHMDAAGLKFVPDPDFQKEKNDDKPDPPPPIYA